MKNNLFSGFINKSWLWLYLLALPVQGSELQTLRGHVPARAKGLVASSPLPGTNRLNLAIALPLRNPEALTNLIRDIYNPASSRFRHFLTPEEFTAQFGPSESDYQAIAAFAKSNGFTLHKTHSNRVLLDVDASVADIEKAFHLQLHKYHHPNGKRDFYAPDKEPSLNLSVPILYVEGLNNAELPQPLFALSTSNNAVNAAPNAGSGQSGTYAGGDFRAAYVPDTTLTGTGQIVGLLQFDGYTASDITFYETAHSLPNVPLTNVLIDGFNGLPTGNGGEIEVSLDIEMAISMAPGLAGIIVYEAGPSGNWHDILNRMANDNLARQLSCSWFIPNGPSDPVADGIFQQMATQGQSFFAASGDSDAFAGLIPFPSDSPYVTVVGGTTLTTTGALGTRVSETVWNRGNGGGSGGGISTQYSIPSWQTNINMAVNKGSTIKRNIPDVALTAENIEARADGFYVNLGGTSCAAPLWAGFTALVNQQAAASGKPPVGFINPALDAIGTSANYTQQFYDITAGNNTNSSSPSNFFAVTGYDLCTGWGTPHGQSLITALAIPEPFLILPSQGFATIGGAGGPFNVSLQSLSLTNAGTNSLNWVLTNAAPWLSVSATSGTLTGGGPSTNVIVSLNATASNLMVGNYSATIWFTNLNDNYAQGLQYSLTILSPPVFAVQPTNQSVLDGATATFSAIVGGALPLAYHWRLNGTNLVDGGNVSGSTTNLLTITNTTATNAGTYTLVVTNAAGTATSSNAVLSITPSAPVITQQPTNQTVTVGSPAQFTIAAIGNKPFFYQWTLGGTPLIGATNSSLSLNNVQMTNGGNYAVLVSNSINSTLSSNALLTVNPLPSCAPSPTGLVGWWQGESNPQDATGGANGVLAGGASYGTGEVGKAFTFTGNASGVQLGNASNLWLQSFTIEMWLKRASSSQISLTATEGDLFAFSSNGYGLGLNNSGGLFLTKVGISSVTAPAAVTDTNWHHVAVSKSGSNVVFYLDGVAYQVVPYDPGFTFTTALAIGASGTNLVSSFFGSIDEVGVYNRGLSANEIQLIYAVGTGGRCPLPPSIITQPSSQSVYVGNTVNFSAAANGSQPLFYQWRFNGTNINGATNAVLPLINVQLTNAGNYAVIVSNTANSVLSSNASLTVMPIPPCNPAPAGLVAWWQAEGNALDITGNDNGTLVGGVTYGTGEVSQGFNLPGSSSGVQLGNPANLRLQNFTIEMWVKRASLTVFSKTASEAELFCYDTGGYGFAMNSSGFILTQVGISQVSVPALVTDTNWHHVAVSKNVGTVVFYLDGVAYPAAAYNPTFTFGSGVTIGSSGPSLLSSFYGFIDELAVYNRDLTQTEIQSIYTAGAGGKCVPPPVITSQPVNQTVPAGNTAAFSVVATGTPPLFYQWTFNGTNLNNATNTSLILNNVQFTNAGNYAVLVGNQGASVQSSNALLTVNPRPPCTPPPAGLVGWWKAESNAQDAAGTNNGVLAGNVSYGSGEVGQAFSFSGNASGVQLGNPATFQLQNFTIELWLKRGSSTIVSSNAPEGELFCFSSNGYGFGLNSTGGLFLTKVGVSSVTSAATVADINWHHLAMSKNGTNVVFYLDGTAYPAAAYDPGFTFTTSLTIGASGTNRVSSFYGLMDEIAFYNRGLTTTEIQNIYAATAGGKCPLPPTFASQPTNQAVYMGVTIAFSAAVNGTPPLFYQWTFNGNNLNGATDTSLTLTNVQSTNAGNYALLVSNSVNSALSSNALLTVNPLPPCATPVAGLISWWPGEGNAADAGSTNNGALTSGVTYGSGEVGQAFLFSGNASGVQLGSPTNLSLQDFTIETWIKRASNSLISSNGTEGDLLAFGTSGYAFGVTNNGTLFLKKVGSTAVAASASVTDTNWHHVAVCKSGTSVVFYLDSTAYPAAAYNPGFLFTTPATIGASGTNLTSSFYGSIDELAVYNRALAASEIQLIYLEGGHGKCVPTVTIATQPVSQVLRPACSATLSVVPAGKPPFSYQWWKGGTALASQTDSNLTFNSIQNSNFGTYFVIVSNAFGISVTSSTAALVQDHVPVPGSHTLKRFASGGVKISVAALLTNDTDADGDLLSIVGVSGNSFANGTVSLQGNWIYYLPPANNANPDIYTYTIFDGHCGGTATGFVSVQVQPDSAPSGTYAIQLQSGAASLSFDGGIPGAVYRIQYTQTLNSPNWQDLTNEAADPFGSFQFIDNQPANAPARYYRSVTP